MDWEKIFLKGACPTSIGGQAVMEGVMMRGLSRTAIAIRLPDGRIHIKTEPNKKRKSWTKLPLIRGVVSFFSSLIDGMKWLLYAADVLEASTPDEEEDKKESKVENWIVKKFGEKALWNLMLYFSIAISLVVTILAFVLLPTYLVNFLKHFTENKIILNLSEGILRIIIFVVYIFFVSKTKDIKRVFQFHGAEHKTIHCFEKNLELTPENAQKFYTLHPRCGTSFLMFVMIVSLIVFSMLGWPSLPVRIASRILLLPVVAALSYELLRWAGRSDSYFIRVMSIPGLYLQKITTKEPDDEHLEIAVASMEAVLVPDETPYIEGYCDKKGRLIEERIISNR